MTKLSCRYDMRAMILTALWLLAAAAIQAAEGLAQQTNREGTVIVKVTPLELSQNSTAWLFELVFDTHVAELNHDLLSVITLSDGNREVSPMNWKGDAPDGHHRKGVLQFKPLQPAPPSVTLLIREVGGVAERRFTWPVAMP